MPARWTYGLVDGKPAVVDLKTSAGLPPTIGPQLAAYAKASRRQVAAAGALAF